MPLNQITPLVGIPLSQIWGPLVSVTRGDSPIVLGQPHVGTHVPHEIFVRLNPRGQGMDDTDWHIDRLYDGLLPGATLVRAHIHRYAIDANRDPAGALPFTRLITILCVKNLSR